MNLFIHMIVLGNNLISSHPTKDALHHNLHIITLVVLTTIITIIIIIITAITAITITGLPPAGEPMGSKDSQLHNSSTLRIS